MKICVSVCTRRRPKMLTDCLNSILPQIRDANCGDAMAIVENDTEQRARTMIDDFATRFPAVQILYVHEPDLGIPIARNRCIETARTHGADWMAFIDDDEVAEPGWLEAMRRGARELNADVVTGPVFAPVPPDLPIWMAPPKRKTKPRGQLQTTAGTSNTLLRMSWFDPPRQDFRFDESLRFTGGSDTDFFYRLTDMGGTIVWVDDAVLSEEITEERLSFAWQLKRAHRTAANNYWSQRKRRGVGYALSQTVPKAAGRFAGGVAQLVVSVPVLAVARRHGARLMFKGAKALASAAGSVQGIFGSPPNPYKTTTGG